MGVFDLRKIKDPFEKLANIFAGYNKDINNNAISSNGSYSIAGTKYNSATNKYEAYTYTTDKIDEYLENRKRKLTIIDTLLQTERNGKRTADNIDKLICDIQPAGILQRYGENLSARERDIKRADFLREKLG